MLQLPMSAFITAGFYFSSFMFAMSAVLLLLFYFFRWASDRLSYLIWSSVYMSIGFLVWLLTGNIIALISVIGINALVFFALRKLMPTTSAFGLFFLMSLMMPSFYGIIWFLDLTYLSIQLLDTHILLKILLWFGAALFAILMAINTAMWNWIFLARYSKLYYRFPRLRNAWKKAGAAPLSFQPWVSIHVPCYSEPPEVVIQTLNALASLQYSHFEVLVIDNNTKDLTIWKPLEEHCLQLGKPFRFYHFDHLEGAKAGALNQALRLTDPQMEIISVIDADYIVEPDFLKKLVKFFEDPQLGFVQACQDYREWRKSNYLSACYFEYQNHFKLELPGQNEWDVNYTIGTLCLIRRKALEDAGGWAEWCLTEDSEVAVRIHALGYTGQYLKSTFGYGLIPETFESYKQQRFRWSAGPVQQFQKHWRLYLPWHHSGLTLVQKWGEICHSLSTFFSEAFNFFINFLLLALCLWLNIHYHQSLVLPSIVLWLIPIAIMNSILCNWIHIQLLGGKWKDTLLASIAARALVYTRNKAFYKACFNKQFTWTRTDKFKMSYSFGRIYHSSKEEILLGCVYVMVLILLSLIINFRHPDILFLIWLGFMNQTLSLFCAPLMAFLSEREIQKGEHS